MTQEDPLRADLCQLARVLAQRNVSLFVAGGYGLILKEEYVREHGLATVASIYPTRATEDLDVFLSAELVTDAAGMEALRDVLRELEYEPVETAKYYQWTRTVEVGGIERTTKVDILAQLPKDTSTLKLDSRRVRPRSLKGLHAHPADEAEFVDLKAIKIEVCRDEPLAFVYVPHPFNYLLLKLFALRDRLDDEEVDYGRHHAFDLYQIVRMLTRDEWVEVSELRSSLEDTDLVREARGLAVQLFGDQEQVGALRLREHLLRGSRDINDYSVEEFCRDLQKLLCGDGKT